MEGDCGDQIAERLDSLASAYRRDRGKVSID